MTLSEKFESLHPDIIQSFLQTRQSEGIAPEVQRFILILDTVPELQRKFPNISRCARELMRLYPDYNLAFHTAREYIYTAINYFHLNSTVRNEAWNQYYADRAEDLHNICVKLGNIKQAAVLLEMAHRWRLSKNENEIDVTKLVPIKQVLSPKVTPKLLNLKEYNLHNLWSETNKMYKEASQIIDSYDINSEEKEALKNEVRLNLNIEDVEPK